MSDSPGHGVMLHIVDTAVALEQTKTIYYHTVNRVLMPMKLGFDQVPA